MESVKCAVCEKELNQNMEVEYSRHVNEFFCSTECAADRYFGYMESTCVDMETSLPENVEINDTGVLVRAVEQSVEPTRDSGEAIPGVCDEIEELWAE